MTPDYVPFQIWDSLQVNKEKDSKVFPVLRINLPIILAEFIDHLFCLGPLNIHTDDAVYTSMILF